MTEEGPSNTVRPNGSEPRTAPPKTSGNEGTTRYEVGPGFEIALRSGANRTLEVTLNGETPGGPSPTRRGGAHGPDREAEKRMDAIERSILILAQHMQKLDERLSGAAWTGPKQKP